MLLRLFVVGRNRAAASAMSAVVEVTVERINFDNIDELVYARHTEEDGRGGG